jgi:threonine dehydratase
MIPAEWLFEAQERLGGKVLRTPLLCDEEAGIYLKLENLQTTGSFKIRGALNRVLTLTCEERDRIVTASAGNHGLGVAQAVRMVGGKAIIYVSDHAVPEKVSAIRTAGGEIREVQGGYGGAESAAIEFAVKSGGTYISPYNDAQIIAGQATVGFELIEQLAEKTFRSIVVPVGGGGLLAGVGLAFHQAGLKVDLVGVNPVESQFFHSQFTHGSQAGVEDRPTLADGLAGAIDPQAITFPILKTLDARTITVEEEDIRRAIQVLWWKYGQRVEGSAAIALAAVLTDPTIEKPAALVLSGGNIQPEVFSALLGEGF